MKRFPLSEASSIVPKNSKKDYCNRYVYKSMEEKISIKMHLKEYFEAFERMLKDQFDLSTGASGGHIGAMGENRERILIDFFQKHIPSRFSVEQRGIIFDSVYNRSDQVDIIIYEHNYPKLGGQNPTLYFVEGVGGFVEVKSTLGKDTLAESLKNIASVKRLRLSPTNVFIGNISQPVLIFGGVFAFKNKLSNQDIFRILEESEIEKRFLPDFIYSNDGLFLFKSIDGSLVPASSDSTKLFYFLIHISCYISGMNLVPIDLKEYLN